MNDTNRKRNVPSKYCRKNPYSNINSYLFESKIKFVNTNPKKFGIRLPSATELPVCDATGWLSLLRIAVAATLRTGAAGIAGRIGATLTKGATLTTGATFITGATFRTAGCFPNHFKTLFPIFFFLNLRLQKKPDSTFLLRIQINGSR
jgi:hypothetical protein